MSDRLALIIANSEFDDPKLSWLVTPSRDAEAPVQMLGDPAIGGFDVTLLVNRTMRVLRREIARLYQRRRKGDLLLLYYSGHGIKDDYGDLYLAVRDTETDVVSATALDAAFVRDRLDKSGSQRKVVVLDCCHSGAFVRGAKAVLGSSAGTLEAFEGSGFGRVILIASNAVEYAWEGDKLLGEAATSVFTRFLVQGLQTGAADLDGDGKISLKELYDYVYEQVLTSGLSRQTPQMSAPKVEGQIIIARNPRPLVKPAELPPELQQAIKSPLTWMREGVVSELERLLHGGDKGLALAAHEALARLAGDDSRRVSAAAASALGTFPEAAVVQPSVAPTPPVKVRMPAPKPDVLTITSPIHLELVLVPAGEFLMGSDPAKDKDARDNEQPQHRVSVSEFYIGKCPVTNEQYVAFVKATKHKAPGHWKKGKIPSGEEDHPVVSVSWYDAVAFCEWLTEKTGRSFRLPAEVEWEKAARGTDGRIYPWGDERPTAELCNFDMNVGGTTPAGRYSPRGDSCYGCADMAGNVWEWTQSLYKGYPYDPVDGREDLGVGGRRVLRGGAFFNRARYVRCAYRYRSDPFNRYVYYGFRVVVASPVHL